MISVMYLAMSTLAWREVSDVIALHGDDRHQVSCGDAMHRPTREDSSDCHSMIPHKNKFDRAFNVR